MPASWNKDAIISKDNQNIGVVMRWGQDVITNEGSKKINVDGAYSNTIKFDVVRPDNVNLGDINTGEFNASATLKITEQ